jgi:hypothetical protein
MAGPIVADATDAFRSLGNRLSGKGDLPQSVQKALTINGLYDTEHVIGILNPAAPNLCDGLEAGIEC